MRACVCVCHTRDDVEWGEEQKREAEEKVALNSQCPVSDGERGE